MESKAFSKSMLNKIPGNLFTSNWFNWFKPFCFWDWSFTLCLIVSNGFKLIATNNRTHVNLNISFSFILSGKLCHPLKSLNISLKSNVQHEKVLLKKLEIMLSWYMNTWHMINDGMQKCAYSRAIFSMRLGN